MADREWPYKPIHITDIGASSNLDDNLRQLTGKGILAHNHVQGIQSAISDAVGFPTTIVEFSPAGKPVRTDSPALDRLMNPACREFRLHCKEWCWRTDDVHALLFLENDGYKSRETLEKNIEVARADPARACLLGDDLRACRHDQSGCVYLSYHCRWLGYLELVFPIILEGKLLGVFLVGHIVFEEDRQRIEERIADVRNRQLACDRCIDASSKVVSESAICAILKEHRIWIAKPKIVHEKDDLPGIVGKVCEQLSDLEGRQLTESLDLRRNRYINEKVAAVIEQFSSGLPNEIKAPQETLARLWSCAEKAFESIVKYFYLDYTVLFGVNRITATTVHQLNVVASAGNVPLQFANDEPAREITLNLDKLDLNYKSGQLQYAASAEHPEYLRALEGCNLEECGDFELTLLPVPLHHQSSIAILVGHKSDHPKIAHENRRDGHLNRSLQAFDALLVSSVSATLAGIAQRIEDHRRRILFHEMMQQSSGLEWTLEALGKLPGKDLENVNRNLRVFIRNIALLYDSVNTIFEETLPFTPRYFNAYDEILFKWKDFYSMEARSNDLEITTEYINSEDATCPTIWGDEALLEQLIYNLVNNAVKYCYRGTRIYLGCCLASDNEVAPRILSVKNYGPEMPKDSSIYDLYVRGTNAGTGQGIGLFLADRIARQHEGRIYHECKQISSFNIPLIRPFLHARKHNKCEWATPALVSEVELENQRIKDVYFKVVALDVKKIPMYRPEPKLITETELRKPTYEVKVMVELPRKGA